MARKPFTPSISNRPPAPSSSTVRNTAIPKTSTPPPPSISQKKQITHEMIAKRAYEIYLSGRGGTADENWARAERELRGY